MFYIHVNQHAIRRNLKTGERQPPIAVKRGRYSNALTASEVAFSGTGRVVYSPDKPLPCGARVWIEIDGAVHRLA